jgi:hypothetical protein
MLGLDLASVEVTKWEDEGASGPEAVALSYLSQGLPGFRGDLPGVVLPTEPFTPRECAACKSSRATGGLGSLARISERAGHGVLDEVFWIDEPGDRAERTLAAAREAFMLR